MLKAVTIAICDVIGFICAGISFFILCVIVSAIVNQDPIMRDHADYKRVFLGVIGPLIVTLTCAGIRSLYNEKTN